MVINLTRMQKIIIYGITLLILTLCGYLLISKQTSDAIVIEKSEQLQLNTNSSTHQGNSEKEITIHITGAVINPGVVKLKEGCRIIDALDAAGGASTDADLENINLAFKVSDGMMINVPKRIETKKTTLYTKPIQQAKNSLAQTANNPYTTNSSTNKPQSYITVSTGVYPKLEGITETEMININTATSEQLQKLEGIGPVTAQKIIDYRNSQGPFNKSEDLMNVKGIGETRLERIKNRIIVSIERILT